MFLAASAAAPLAVAEPEQWDAEGQLNRRARIYELHRKACASLFSSDGAWIGPPTESTGRIRFWHSMSLLSAPETREKANRILQKSFADRSGFKFTFSHFEHCGASQLLAKQTVDLEPATRQLLAGLVREGLSRPSRIDFLGYNDNFPAMTNVLATLGGEAIEDPAACRRGIEGMRRLLDLLHRRGLLSEYTSPTYSSVTLLCYADIAEHSKDAEARRLALEIERRIWQDVAAHFHLPTNLLAGPHSRAYGVDSCGQLSQVQMMLYQAFGERVWLNPVRYLFPPVEKQLVHHDGDVAFMQASNVWKASSTYHPGAEIERLLFEKRFPFSVMATAENGAFTYPILEKDAAGEFRKSSELLEYPCGEVVTTTYMTADYAAGSASTPFGDGSQTDAFYVNYRRAGRPASLDGIGTIFSRYCVNDNAPGLPCANSLDPKAEKTLDLLPDFGRAYTVQKGPTILALYQAKGQYVSEYTSLRLTLVLPVFYRNLKRIGIGESERSASDTPDIVWIEDEFLYAAFRPLISTNHGRRNAVSVSHERGYTAVSFHNYEGPARPFKRQALLHTLNGFVAEIGSKSEYGSFDKFRGRVMEGRAEDMVAAGQRFASYERAGLKLSLAHSLDYGVIKYALVDGELQPRPKWLASGA